MLLSPQESSRVKSQVSSKETPTHGGLNARLYQSKYTQPISGEMPVSVGSQDSQREPTIIIVKDLKAHKEKYMDTNRYILPIVPE